MREKDTAERESATATAKKRGSEKEMVSRRAERERVCRERSLLFHARAREHVAAGSPF